MNSEASSASRTRQNNKKKSEMENTQMFLCYQVSENHSYFQSSFSDYNIKICVSLISMWNVFYLSDEQKSQKHAL